LELPEFWSRCVRSPPDSTAAPAAEVVTVSKEKPEELQEPSTTVLHANFKVMSDSVKSDSGKPTTIAAEVSEKVNGNVAGAGGESTSQQGSLEMRKHVELQEQLAANSPRKSTKSNSANSKLQHNSKQNSNSNSIEGEISRLLAQPKETDPDVYYETGADMWAGVESDESDADDDLDDYDAEERGLEVTKLEVTKGFKVHEGADAVAKGDVDARSVNQNVINKSSDMESSAPESKHGILKQDIAPSVPRRHEISPEKHVPAKQQISPEKHVSRKQEIASVQQSIREEADTYCAQLKKSQEAFREKEKDGDAENYFVEPNDMWGGWSSDESGEDGEEKKKSGKKKLGKGGSLKAGKDDASSGTNKDVLSTTAPTTTTGTPTEVVSVAQNTDTTKGLSLAERVVQTVAKQTVGVAGKEQTSLHAESESTTPKWSLNSTEERAKNHAAHSAANRADPIAEPIKAPIVEPLHEPRFGTSLSTGSGYQSDYCRADSESPIRRPLHSITNEPLQSGLPIESPHLGCRLQGPLGSGKIGVKKSEIY
jgi:hypothetical protein